MYIIDRFEGSWAIVETGDRQTFNLPVELIPEAKEGDIINITVTVDKEATVQRRLQANNSLKNFFDE